MENAVAIFLAIIISVFGILSIVGAYAKYRRRYWERRNQMAEEELERLRDAAKEK